MLELFNPFNHVSHERTMNGHFGHKFIDTFFALFGRPNGGVWSNVGLLDYMTGFAGIILAFTATVLFQLTFLPLSVPIFNVLWALTLFLPLLIVSGVLIAATFIFDVIKFLVAAALTVALIPVIALTQLVTSVMNSNSTITHNDYQRGNYRRAVEQQTPGNYTDNGGNIYRGQQLGVVHRRDNHQLVYSEDFYNETSDAGAAQFATSIGSAPLPCGVVPPHQYGSGMIYSNNPLTQVSHSISRSV